MTPEISFNVVCYSCVPTNSSGCFHTHCSSVLPSLSYIWCWFEEKRIFLPFSTENSCLLQQKVDLDEPKRVVAAKTQNNEVKEAEALWGTGKFSK